jgi:hypothetical protein
VYVIHVTYIFDAAKKQQKPTIMKTEPMRPVCVCVCVCLCVCVGVCVCACVFVCVGV